MQSNQLMDVCIQILVKNRSKILLANNNLLTEALHCILNEEDGYIFNDIEFGKVSDVGKDTSITKKLILGKVKQSFSFLILHSELVNRSKKESLMSNHYDQNNVLKFKFNTPTRLDASDATYISTA